MLEKKHVIFHSDISDIDKGGASSATDCTGLIPSDPKSREERASYEDIMDYSADDIPDEAKHTESL